MIASIRWTILLVTIAVFLGILVLLSQESKPRSAGRYTTQYLPPPEQTKEAYRRTEAKDQVTRQLLAGDMTLLQAASWFRYINKQNTKGYQTDWPGNSEEEKLCRQVILWARHQTEEELPPATADIICQLECELEVLLAAGAIELPW